MRSHSTAIFILAFLPIVLCQDFLSFIKPFLGGGLNGGGGGGGPEAPTGGGFPFAQAFGSALNGAGGGGNGNAGLAALASAFTGGQGGGEESGNNPFGDLVNLGRTFANFANAKVPQPPPLQMTPPPNNWTPPPNQWTPAPRSWTPPPPSEPDPEEEMGENLEAESASLPGEVPRAHAKPTEEVETADGDLIQTDGAEKPETAPNPSKAPTTTPEPLPAVAATTAASGSIDTDFDYESAVQGRKKRQSNPLELISRFLPTGGRSSGSGQGVSRLADRFGKNFFGFLDELHEYSKLQPDPSAPVTTTTAPTLPTLFPNLFTLPSSATPLFPAAPSPQPIQPVQQSFAAPPLSTQIPAYHNTWSPGFDFPSAGPNLIAMDVGMQSPMASDLLDANNLMRGFLRSVAKAGERPLKPLPARDDGTEAGRNRPLMDQLFESDILLTSKQMKAIVVAEAEKRGGRSRRVKRKVITGSVYRWPKGAPIPFSFRDPDKEWRQLIREGLKLWERETCLRFRENGIAKDRIEFIRGGGCYSSVGKTGGSQKISIGYGCEDKGIVSHEVGHSLGFWHEQSRPDRDKYISLNQKYIAGGTDGNFAKRSDLESDGMGLPYDLGSVMHYGPTAFTLDWDQNTIITKDKKYQHTIGQRKGPSFIDVKQINRLYCFHSCTGTTVRCQNGGYADPNNCQQCKCPPGLGGPTCAHVEQSQSALCGGELTAQPMWQHLTYKGKQKCVWRIRARGARIRLILDKASYQCETTCKQYVEIKHNSDFQQIGFRSCCDEKNQETVSDQDEVIIIHDSSIMAHDGAFTLRYIQDSGAPLPRPPPPAWVPGSENRAFRGVQGKGGLIEKFILNAIPRVRDPNKPVESVFSIFTDYVASSFLGASRDNTK